VQPADYPKGLPQFYQELSLEKTVNIATPAGVPPGFYGHMRGHITPVVAI